MSTDQTEQVTRNEEIRAIFIFGLLAVFAYVKTQYKTLTLVYPNGSFNLIPVINILIILWSLYAFFMVLGLSRDAIGKPASDTFRRFSPMFLQYSFILLGVFGFLFGIVVYGSRILFILFIMLVAVISGLYVHFKNRPKGSHVKRLSLREYLKSEKIKKDIPFILGLIFLLSVTVVFQYPNSWFASTVIIWTAFVVAVATVIPLVAFSKPKNFQENGSKE